VGLSPLPRARMRAVHTPPPPPPSPSSLRPLPQKENFLQSLDKRRALIADDVKADTQALEVLRAHVAAINSRIRILKNERVARELTAQRNQFVGAYEKLKRETDNLQSVSSALGQRVESIERETAPLRANEKEHMQRSLGVAGGAGAAGSKPAVGAKPAKAAPAAAAAGTPPAATTTTAAAAAAPAPAPAAFAQSELRDGDGDGEAEGQAEAEVARRDSAPRARHHRHLRSAAEAREDEW
jgi:cell division protein FtsL